MDTYDTLATYGTSVDWTSLDPGPILTSPTSVTIPSSFRPLSPLVVDDPREETILPLSASPSYDLLRSRQIDRADSVSVATRRALGEAKIAAAVRGWEDKVSVGRLEEERRRRLDKEGERMIGLARTIEQDRFNVASQALTQMLSHAREVEEWRKERWRQAEQDRQRMTDELEALREEHHRRELERQREVQTECEKVIGRVKELEKQREEDFSIREERQRRQQQDRDRQLVDRIEALHRQTAAEMQKLRQDMENEKSERYDFLRKTQRELESRLEGEYLDETLGGRSHVELQSLKGEVEGLKQERTLLQKQVAEAKEREQRVTRQKDKEIDRLKNEIENERRSRLTAIERIERERRDADNQMHQRLREAETREWRTNQQLQEERRLREAQEDERNREVSRLHKELDDLRSARPANATDEKDEVYRERDRLRSQLRQAEERLRDEQDRTMKQIQGLKLDMAALKEKEVTAIEHRDRLRNDLRAKEQELADAKARFQQKEDEVVEMGNKRVQLEKERAERLQGELDSMHKQWKDAEDEKVKANSVIRELQWEQQKLKEEKLQVEKAKLELENDLRSKVEELRSRDSRLRLSEDKTLKEVKDKEELLRQKEEKLKKEADELNEALRSTLNSERKRADEAVEKFTTLEVEHTRMMLAAQEAESKLKADLAEARKKMEKLEEDHRKEVENLERRTKTIEESKGRSQDQLREDIERLRKQLQDALDQGVDEQKKHRESLEEVEKKYKKEVTDLQMKLEEAKSEGRREAMMTENANKALQAAKDQLAKEQQKLKELRQERTLQEQFERKAFEWTQIMKDRFWELENHMREQSHKLLTEADQMRSKEYDANAEAQRLKAIIESTEKENVTLREEKRTLERDLGDAKMSLSETKRKLDDANDRIPSLQKEIIRLEQSNKEMKTTMESTASSTEKVLQERIEVLQKEKRVAEDKAEESAKLRLVAEKELDELRNAPGKAAPPAPPPAPVQTKPPAMLVIRSSSRPDIAGLYCLVEGGLKALTDDATLSDFPLSNCVWVREETPKRWLYSSSAGEWRLTDGGGSLKGDIKAGRTLPGVFEVTEPHQGVLPHLYLKWAHGTTCGVPPPELVANGPRFAGRYAVSTNVVNGWPSWEGPGKFLFTSPKGRWCFTESREDLKATDDVATNEFSVEAHQGLMPEEMTYVNSTTVTLCAVGDRVRVRNSTTAPWKEGLVQSLDGGRPYVKVDDEPGVSKWTIFEKIPEHCAEKREAELRALVDELQQEKRKAAKPAPAPAPAESVKVLELEKELREAKVTAKTQQSRADDLDAEVKRLKVKLQEAEKELTTKSASGGGASGDVEALNLRIQELTHERNMFKENAERNEKLLIEAYSKK